MNTTIITRRFKSFDLDERTQGSFGKPISLVDDYKFMYFYSDSEINKCSTDILDFFPTTETTSCEISYNGGYHHVTTSFNNENTPIRHDTVIDMLEIW